MKNGRHAEQGLSLGFLKFSLIFANRLISNPPQAALAGPGRGSAQPLTFKEFAVFVRVKRLQCVYLTVCENSVE